MMHEHVSHYSELILYFLNVLNHPSVDFFFSLYLLQNFPPLFFSFVTTFLSALLGTSIWSCTTVAGKALFPPAAHLIDSTPCTYWRACVWFWGDVCMYLDTNRVF